MNKEDVITLSDNKEYLILDIIEVDNKKYLYCVEIGQNEIPTNEYIYAEVTMEDGETFVEEVTDPKRLEAIVSLFTINYLNESEEQAA